MYDTYVPLPGSEREPHATATVSAEPVDPEARVEVTVLLDPSGLQQDENAVIAWAASIGLEIIAADYRMKRIRLAGTAAQMQDAFRVYLVQAETQDGVQFRQRTGAVSIPSELQNAIVAVLGLDNRPQARSYAQVHPDAANPNALSASTVAKLYSFPPGDGSGQCVAIIELGGGFSAADNTAAGIGAGLVTAVGVDGATNAYSGNPNSADGEVALDIQVVGGVAPKVKQAVFFAPNTDAGFVDAILAVVHDTTNKPCAISISWGAPESAWTAQARNAMDVAFQQAAAAGIPVFAASGDNGSRDGASADTADYPASSPYATGCGGTQLAGSGSTITSEVVWDDLPAGGGAGGGGVSSVYPAPSWQANVPNSGKRGVPDVAGNAAPATGYPIRLKGHSYVFGGTSAVAPLYAGLAAILCQSLGKHIGSLNPQIYAMPVGTFRDITQGNNGTYQAAAGWDACTGLGSPNGAALLAALQGAAPAPPPPTPPPATKTVSTIVVTFTDGTQQQLYPVGA